MSTRHVATSYDLDTAAHSREAWCGYEFKLFDFAILGPGHAAACIQQNTLVQPCKRCVAKIKAAGQWPEVSESDTGGRP